MRRGFTLIELIVVTALLAIVAALVVPRLTSMSRREADVAVERLSELLSMFAFRDGSGAANSAIWLDPETGCVTLWALESDPANPTEEPEWVPDRHVQPVCMPSGVELDEVRLDGRSLAGMEWRIMGSPTGERSEILMRVIADGFESELVLAPGAGVPVRTDNGVVRGRLVSPIDLDQMGMDREPW
jgi:prepilin-type N-terminal cleavage/methylation domain-containing protein